MNVYIETYGCQMNVNDSEVVLSILEKAGYRSCGTLDQADLILINTCSVRDNAEQRVLGRLDVFRQEKKRRGGVVVGVLGCMAQRMKEKLLDNPAVDFVAGPDAYRDVPRLVAAVAVDGKQINTLLSHEETYADVTPVRMDREGVSAFISIMRGCNNVCSYCIVPFVRGAERSRDPQSIVREAAGLIAAGYKEINLLGQNVDSYDWHDPEDPARRVTFADLLERVAELNPRVRVRFATSHPKDIGDAVLFAMARHANICRHIHFPVQSGSDVMLEKMRRKYTRAHYLQQVARIREILPDCAITTDVIAGFSGETDADHADTMSLFRAVRYDSAFMFQYSERPGTLASRHYPDDVPLAVKTARLNEIIALQNEISLEINRECVGRTYEVLIEGPSKRSAAELMGRTSQNKTCVFPAEGHKAGEYVTVRVLSCTSATLRCEIVG
ncbi:MAG: tRNA (N6-isopentenyl adenosine(37)-C2)-methylthiotransferase MiaB [Bacteroidales bacterium]|nr:tRNA (N6-isopentenyl adenosine(37)-C2)-methylthiotransferase MiaB [Bacteroidales bacterium]MBQ2194747.1 tRNA (N6-isopentenyl adenosine(37)-C2)-methylthiotransferase MiaB [Bacteroidales bacterium]MBQ4222163.1 tRNA (N6-isopentenyl adenosine(37)-C2)-methylthiotransferase MiaB [Bacteroidales bacterium]MBQ5529755.1 tRNA (N6-isopentenyl adenosine(37)-C2)-methylthiotransferase MiaB [Bacteroidales bacterium]